MRGTVDLFTDTAAVMQPEHDTAVGTQQLTAAYRTGLDTLGIEITFHCEDILAKGDLAVVRLTGTGTVKIRANGQSMVAKFRELFVLERFNGEWKIARYTFQQMGHK